MIDDAAARISGYAEAYGRECERIEAAVTVGMSEMARWYWRQEFHRLGVEALTDLGDARPLGDAELYSLARRARIIIEADYSRALQALYRRPSTWETFTARCAARLTKWGWR